MCSLNSLDKFESDWGPFCLLAYLWGPGSELEAHHCCFLIVASRVQAHTITAWIIFIIIAATQKAIIVYMPGTILKVWHVLSHLVSSQPYEIGSIIISPLQKITFLSPISVPFYVFSSMSSDLFIHSSCIPFFSPVPTVYILSGSRGRLFLTKEQHEQSKGRIKVYGTFSRNDYKLSGIQDTWGTVVGGKTKNIGPCEQIVEALERNARRHGVLNSQVIVNLLHRVTLMTGVESGLERDKQLRIRLP